MGGFTPLHGNSTPLRLPVARGGARWGHTKLRPMDWPWLVSATVQHNSQRQRSITDKTH